MIDAANPALVFDRRSVRRRRERATGTLAGADYLRTEVFDRLVDRLGDVTRRFDRVLDLSVGEEDLAPHLPQAPILRAVISAASTLAPLAGAVIFDEEFLPCADNSLDLVFSNLSLHSVNDLPGTLTQINRALKPDGLFMASLFGGATLNELRSSFLSAEAELRGGVSPRVAPGIDIRDAGNLLTRAGFALPVVDLDRITVSFPTSLNLMRDLKAMGETNCLTGRHPGLVSPELLARTVSHYDAHFQDAEGRVTASFDILFLTAWAPHATQPKPLAPGSATTRLADVLGTTEKLL